MGKSPTGNRPVPEVTPSKSSTVPNMNKTREAPKHTPMPAPKTKWGNRSNPSSY